MSFTITPKTTKYLSIHLTKHVQDLYAENYEMLMKKIKEDLNKLRYTMFMDWKAQHRKMLILSKLLQRINVIPSKTSARFFWSQRQHILKFTWKGTTCRTAKTILTKKNNKVG